MICHVSDNYTIDNLFCVAEKKEDERIDFTKATYPFLRSFIAQAVSGKYLHCEFSYIHVYYLHLTSLSINTQSANFRGRKGITAHSIDQFGGL